MSINNNEWPPAHAGANIPTEQGLAEEAAFAKKYPERSAYYEQPLEFEFYYTLGTKQLGAAYFCVLNTLDGERIGNGRCGLTEKGQMIGVSRMVAAGYKQFREQTQNDQTAMYGFDIDFVLGEFKKALDLGYDYVRFCNGINAQGLNTLFFGFRKNESEEVMGISSFANNPFLCPPLCPPPPPDGD